MSTRTSILIGLFFLSSSLSLAACLELDLKEVNAEDMTAQDMTLEDMTADDVIADDVIADDVIAGDMTAQDMMVTSCGDGQLDRDEQCDDGNSFDGDGCDTLCQWEPDLCDGLDNNGDGEADEVIFDVPTSLHILFSMRTAIDPDNGTISILNREREHIQGSPFTGDSLTGQVVSVPDNGFYIRIQLGEGGTATYGYEIEEIRDQTGRLIDGPYPSIASLSTYELIPVPFDNEQRLSAGDSRGAGAWCGLGIGECQIGRLSCLGGILDCSGEGNEQSEVCDGLDNDCDGQTDETVDLEPELCESQQGVCSGVYKVCDDGELRCPYDTITDYQELEVGCDCLDNNCDGVIDQNGDETLGCLFFQVVEPGALGRDCVVHVGSSIVSGDYRFGSLTIAEGVALEVSPMTSEYACGFEGLNNCAFGGGCLSISAQNIIIDGSIEVNAAEVLNPPEGVSLCGGASGGDLKIEADLVTLNGRLEASGGDAWQANGVTISERAGGGTGGSVQIRAHRIDLGERAVIKSLGGRGSDLQNPAQNAGGGAGKEGGARGGAGAGGSGGTNAGSPNPDRSVALIGDVVNARADQLIVGRFDEFLFGYIDLGGTAGALQPELSENNGLGVQVFMLSLHLTDYNGLPIASQVVLYESEVANEASELGTTDDYGWLSALSYSLPLRFDESLNYRLSLSGADSQSGMVFYTYFNPDDQDLARQCSGLIPFNDGIIEISPFIDCE